MLLNTKAFTLAEVLITLLIIGVVASIIVPNLINDARDAELKTAWKKAYAEIAQATKKIMMDNGGTIKNLCTSNFNSCYRNAYLPYLSYVKSCNSPNTQGNCWVPVEEMKFLNGNSVPWDFNSSSIVLNSGSAIEFFSFGTVDCSISTWGRPAGKTVCGYMFVDVNGLKSPNIIGKDILGLFVLDDRILPVGSTGDSYTNSCNTSLSGEGCAAKYLYQ